MPSLSTVTLTLSSSAIPLVSTPYHRGKILNSTLSSNDHIFEVLHHQKFEVFLLEGPTHQPEAVEIAKKFYFGIVHLALAFASAVWNLCT